MSGNKNRFSKPVAFNKTNANDQKILKHVSRRNFSGYVKKLILADIEAKGEAVELQQEVDEVKPSKPQKESATDRLERLKQKQKRPGTSGPHLFNQQKN